MELIKDLGTKKPKPDSNYKKRYGIYACPFCNKHFECKTAAVKNGKRSCGCVTRELPQGTTNMVFEFISAKGLDYATPGSKYRTTMWEVRCPVCQEISIRTRSSVVNGRVTKCRTCADKTRDTTTGRKSAEQYDNDLKAAHGDDIIRLGPYINSSTKTKHKCICGHIWDVLPSNLLHGSACPYCCKYGFKEDKPALLYYFKVTGSSGHAWKIGVTNLDIIKRYSVKERQAISDIVTKTYKLGAEALEKEAEILETFKDYKYNGPQLLLRGNTELFVKDIKEEVQCIMSQ